MKWARPLTLRAGQQLGQVLAGALGSSTQPNGPSTSRCWWRGQADVAEVDDPVGDVERAPSRPRRPSGGSGLWTSDDRQHGAQRAGHPDVERHADPVLDGHTLAGRGGGAALDRGDDAGGVVARGGPGRHHHDEGHHRRAVGRDDQRALLELDPRPASVGFWSLRLRSSWPSAVSSASLA